jgi:hypothetical protein
MDNQLLNHLYLGIFSRAEQRVLQAIFKAIAAGGGQCVATVAALARDSDKSKRTAATRLLKRCALASSKSRNGDVTQPRHSPAS